MPDFVVFETPDFARVCPPLYPGSSGNILTYSRELCYLTIRRRASLPWPRMSHLPTAWAFCCLSTSVISLSISSLSSIFLLNGSEQSRNQPGKVCSALVPHCAVPRLPSAFAIPQLIMFCFSSTDTVASKLLEVLCSLLRCYSVASARYLR
jgi:hypothetical protein